MRGFSTSGFWMITASTQLLKELCENKAGSWCTDAATGVDQSTIGRTGAELRASEVEPSSEWSSVQSWGRWSSSRSLPDQMQARNYGSLWSGCLAFNSCGKNQVDVCHMSEKMEKQEPVNIVILKNKLLNYFIRVSLTFPLSTLMNDFYKGTIKMYMLF